MGARPSANETRAATQTSVHSRDDLSTAARIAGSALSSPSRCTGIDAADATSSNSALLAFRSRFLTLKRRRPTDLSRAASTSRIAPFHVGVAPDNLMPPWGEMKIGRASCRERVCQYV